QSRPDFALRFRIRGLHADGVRPPSAHPGGDRSMKLALAVVLALLSAPALANDTTSQLGTGGLVFITNDQISMDSEDLSVSPKAVKVVYALTNHGKSAQHALVAFPLPDITGDGDFMVSVPNEDANNLFGFETTFEGKPVQSVLHQYAFAVGIDQTALL